MAETQLSEKKIINDSEAGYDDEQEGRHAEERALHIHNVNDCKILPTRLYLENTLTPLVLKALINVEKLRPPNPIQYVAYFLLKHNPNAQ